MKVTLSPYREKLHYGNIVWAERDQGSSYYRVSRYVKRGGGFTSDYPATDDKVAAFRERGYWASCFPEGDGITYKPLSDQSDEQCMKDVRECFGWDVTWQSGYEPLACASGVACREEKP